jgi:tetratricopeptide (TPR) repeat protein
MKGDKTWPPALVALATLLHDIDDCTAVVGNALVVPYEGDAGGGDAGAQLLHLRVRAALLAAVASLDARGPGQVADARAARQRAIVARCDLRREKHAAVARDLGICLRHFYRERRVALERLLAALYERLRTATPITSGPPSRFELDLDHVAMLRLGGQFDAAFRAIAAVARAAPSAAESVRAWCYAVEIATDVDDGTRAQAFFAEAVQAARDVASDDEEIHAAALDVEMASAFAAWQRHDFTVAAASIENAVSGIRALPPSPQPTRARASIEILFRGAELACLYGNGREALSRLGAARGVLETMAHKPPDVTARLFLELGVVHGLIPGGANRAVEYALEAFETFRACSSSSGVAAAAGSLCTLYAVAGDSERALAFGALALDIARAHGGVAEIADRSLILSQAATLGGDPQRGLVLARSAQGHARGGLYETRAAIAMAEAYVQLRRYGDATALAQLVAQRVAPTWDRYLGVALRIEAEAAYGLGDARRAAQCIEASVAHLERFGHPALLRRAYESSSRLTGRPEHGRLARELL